MTPNNDQAKIPMNLYNTYRVVPTGAVDNECNINPEVHPFVAKLIIQLSKSRPSWEFISVSKRITVGGSRASNQNYCEFRVYDGEHLLGWINREWRHHGDSYVFDNQRLREGRQRGGSTATKDLKKATKLILQHFYSLTPTEQMAECRKVAREEVTAALLHAEHGFRAAYNKIANYVQRYAMLNWEEISQRLPIDDETRALVPTKHEEYQRMRTVHTPWQNRCGAIIHVDGSAYMVSHLHDAEDAVIHHTSDTLPRELKGPLGMLKLLEPKGYIEGVGMRVSDTTYFVILEEKAA